MATSQNPGGPVLIQHTPPPHALSPEVSVVPITAFGAEPHAHHSPPLPEATTGPAIAPTSHPRPSAPELTTVATELLDTEMADTPLTRPRTLADPVRHTDIESLPSQEQRPITEEPPGVGADIPEQLEEEAQIESQGTEHVDQESSDGSSQEWGQESHIPPPPQADLQHSRRDVPIWVTWEDDSSTPTEDELEELALREARGTELNALDVSSVEKRVYQDVDDPEQRPVKKLRLSWILKGVRGTRDNPNYARVMVSPVAEVDGNYWQIKFYPRGNKCSSLSAYIRCSRTPPKAAADIPEGTFSFFAGPPEAELGAGAIPSQTFTIGTGLRGNGVATSTDSSASSDSHKPDDNHSSGYPSTSVHQGTDSDLRDMTDGGVSIGEDWRVPAQLGMVMYNPEEPRTCTYMSSQHQFAKSNDDWGWTNFVGPWSEIHVRQHLQRQPLLQNDTIAIDAYIRIFDDPSQALWWHSSDTEPQWDSKSLAGYYPMGTPPLYHSPAVAGMTAWLLLAPFRQVIQGVNAGAWRQNSQTPPRPVICELQKILFLMRSLKKERETYVDVYPAIHAIKELCETYSDVKTFWEVLRRTVELELGGDHTSLERLSSIFDTPDGPISLPPLPVQGVRDIQQGLEHALVNAKFKGRLPNFLPLFLARQRFDETAREWKLLRDRVVMNEELDVSKYCGDGEPAHYTLYGFVVHVGDRNSGRFYSVLRPDGPGTKWLAFEDGDGNKIFSFTRKRIQEFEGLEGRALRDSNPTGQTAYMTMYINTSCLHEYLPGKLEPYKLPRWLVPHLQSQYQDGVVILEDDSITKDSDYIDVEVHSDEGIMGRDGLLDMFTIQQQCRQEGKSYVLRSPRSATFQELRHQLSAMLNLAESDSICLFFLRYIGTGLHQSARMLPVNLHDLVFGGGLMDQPLCLWMSILKTKEEFEHFAKHDHACDRQPAQATPPSGTSPGDMINSVDAAESDNADEEQMAASDAEQASIRAAVVADVERIAAGLGQPISTLADMSDPDTPMQMESLPPTAEENLTRPVPHGHWIDVAAHQGEVFVGSEGGGDESAQSYDGGVIVASGIAAGAEVTVMDVGANVEGATNASSNLSGPASTDIQASLECIYGLIQFFDVEKQNFIVRSRFFARRGSRVRDVVRRSMGWPAEKEFNVWRRESAVQGVIVERDETFKDHSFDHSTDVIVGETLSDAQIKVIHQQGKYSDPFDLSSYLRMVERKHPVASKTTSEPVELADFGSDYYKGPLVNGRAHGENCLCISSSGERYEGPLICNKRCGKGGKMTYRNGDTYDGEWDDDERHGQGTFVEHRTGNKYVGGFEYGKRWGMGTTYWQVADEQADLCQICYSQEIDALFFDCGHVCSCVECAKQCEICPICRKTVKQVVKMFRA
ncbi:hypothetical protein A1O1_05753 [Capronia coronata CBS 617.96]|uniref:RING-type domain-containing protein n=1 Tax=Capronia coronata CBS 617.96 TaxID=1182541 RepID=W9YSZ4_9EURO|nr:uncharacterized protein A1O1_05753 [Capronia coronata CBS 617.96]EXJ85389.1 hypothetical protein A1O1_05753 [Capronia coronata CBS 617.96]